MITLNYSLSSTAKKKKKKLSLSFLVLGVSGAAISMSSGGSVALGRH